MNTSLPESGSDVRVTYLPHLVAAGRQVFSEGLDGADLVKLYQLRQAVVCLTVSSHRELSMLVLGDDKMAAPVLAPSKENPKQRYESIEIEEPKEASE